MSRPIKNDGFSGVFEVCTYTVLKDTARINKIINKNASKVINKIINI